MNFAGVRPLYGNFAGNHCVVDLLASAKYSCGKAGRALSFYPQRVFS